VAPFTDGERGRQDDNGDRVARGGSRGGQHTTQLATPVPARVSVGAVTRRGVRRLGGEPSRHHCAPIVRELVVHGSDFPWRQLTPVLGERAGGETRTTLSSTSCGPWGRSVHLGPRLLRIVETLVLLVSTLQFLVHYTLTPLLCSHTPLEIV